MKKIYNLILIILFFNTTGCGFTPILSSSNYNFSYVIEESSGSERVNSYINERLRNLNGKEKTYDVILNSREAKNILSKDSKGDPSILEIVINLNYIIKDNEKVLINKILTQRSTYNNISDKFELEKSEEILVENLTRDLAQNIISSTSAISNDN